MRVYVDQARERPAGPSEERDEAGSDARRAGQKRDSALPKGVASAVHDA